MTREQKLLIALAMEKAITAMEAHKWRLYDDTREVVEDLKKARDLVRASR